MTRLEAILFDLDDTLLGNDMDVFVQSYLPLLAAHVRPITDADRFLPELLYATQAMIDSDDPGLTNREVFWHVFCERNGLEQAKVEPHFARFYQERFGELQSRTQRRPEAPEIVGWCMARGLKVVVATNPLFPLAAIEQRLAWAGVPVDQFDFSLVTGYENMHSAKPHGSYYQEILAAVDTRPERALMVGDDWENDIVPASQLGLHTFWIAARDAPTPEGSIIPDGRGSLADIFEKLESGWPVE